MRTALFQDVLFYVASLCYGTSDDLQQQHAVSLVRYLNTQVQTAWEEYPWPELVTVQQRFFRPAWSAGTYTPGSEVYDPTTDAYWTAGPGGATSGDVPGTSANWVADCPLDRYVGYDQAGMTPLGEVVAVWSQNPRTCPQALAVEYWLSDNGVQVGNWLGQPPRTSVWVEFRLRPSQFTAIPWTAGTYAQGRVVYYAVDGNCYLALASTTATPGTDATKWQVVPLPYVLGKYAQQAVYAEWLKEDGQNDKAARESQAAELLLQRAMGQAVIQGQNSSYTVRAGAQLRETNLVFP